MKQILHVGFIAAVMLLSVTTFGQTNEPVPEKTNDGKKTAKTYLDLMINVVSSNLNYGESNSALSDYKKSTHGIQAGISFQAGITPWFSLVPELYYIRKGGQLKANNPASVKGSSLRLNTIELPVLARFHLGKFYMNAGPSVAYNISGKRKMDDQSTKLSFGSAVDGFKRFEAGIQVGGGFEFPVKQKRIALDIRYHYGLTNIATDKTIYNRSVMISVHFSRPWKTNPLGRR